MMAAGIYVKFGDAAGLNIANPIPVVTLFMLLVARLTFFGECLPSLE